MVTNLRIKLATIMLLALTLVAVSIPVMATVYQNGGDDEVKDCATAGDDAVCLPPEQPALEEDTQLACDEPAVDLESDDSECSPVTEVEIQCAQGSSEITCPSAESACLDKSQNTVPVCNANKTACTANKTCNKTTNTTVCNKTTNSKTCNKTSNTTVCNKTTNVTACNLNKTACTANKTSVDKKATVAICNGSTPGVCPEAGEEYTPTVPACAD